MPNQQLDEKPATGPETRSSRSRTEELRGELLGLLAEFESLALFCDQASMSGMNSAIRELEDLVEQCRHEDDDGEASDA